MPYCKKNKIIFIHVPKNAGTAVLSLASFDFDGVKDSHKPASMFRYSYPDLWQEYRKFAIVRNPWDRVVSNFEYAKMEKSHWHSGDSTTVYGLHPDYLTLKDKSFEEAVDLLVESPESLKHPGWWPQTYFICDEDGSLLVDKFFYQDKLDEDSEFNSIFPGVRKINTSTRKSLNYKDYYSLKTFHKVYSYYKTDIDFLNFEY